jgi:hypothetical protein
MHAATFCQSAIPHRIRHNAVYRDLLRYFKTSDAQVAPHVALMAP